MKSSDDLDGYGPAMRALTFLQRRFVREYVEHPTSSGKDAAVRAGYSDSSEAAKVSAHYNLHSERVLAAIREEVDKRLRSHTALGAAVLVEIATDPMHRQRFKAAEALLNHGGFHTMSEQRIKVEHSDMTGEAMIERIRHLAVTLGVDPAKLLGGNDPKLIEATLVSREEEAE